VERIKEMPFGFDNDYVNTVEYAKERAKDHVAYGWSKRAGSPNHRWTKEQYAAYDEEYDRLIKEKMRIMVHRNDKYISKNGSKVHAIRTVGIPHKEYGIAYCGRSLSEVFGDIKTDKPVDCKTCARLIKD
jgi:hypothetical protein